MTERINRRNEIVAAATQLFFEQGYADTSVQQIVDLVGCTKPALYYHFKEGKAALLNEVIQCSFPEVTQILGQVENATTLEAFLTQVSHLALHELIEMVPRFRWLIAEYPRFTEEERRVVHERFQRQMQAGIDFLTPYLESHSEAQEMIMFMFPFMIGAGQLFIGLEFQDRHNLSLEDQFKAVVQMLLSRYG